MTNYKFPIELCGTEFYNKSSLVIHKHLDDAFRKCNNYILNNGINKYLNIVSVFYPLIARLLINYTFIKFEIEVANVLTLRQAKKLMLSKEKSVWPINYQNVLSGKYGPNGYEYLNVSPTSFRIKSKLFIKNCFKAISNLMSDIFEDSNSPLILKSPNAKFNTKNLAKNHGLRSKDIDLYTKIFIPEMENQKIILFSEIHIMEQELGKLFSSKFEFDKAFLSFFNMEISTYCSNSYPKEINANIILLGSLADLKCRIFAAIGKSQNVPIISVWHGENIGDKDEPVSGPIGQTYCDVILGYGEYGCEKIKKGIYNKSLFEQPLIVPSSSSVLKEIFKDNKVKKIYKTKDLTIMYVPTSFSGTNRDGPFRDLHDIAYCLWQQNMLNSVLKIINPKQLIRKRHKKENGEFNFKVNKIKQLHKSDLLDVMDETEVFIFDYPTTAFAYAAATNKPIIYFDIGLRNLMPDALESIKDRCIYVKGNVEDVESMVNIILKNIHKKCVNTYTDKYSVSNDSRSRKDILLDTIKEYAIS